MKQFKRPSLKNRLIDYIEAMKYVNNREEVGPNSWTFYSVYEAICKAYMNRTGNTMHSSRFLNIVTLCKMYPELRKCAPEHIQDCDTFSYLSKKSNADRLLMFQHCIDQMRIKINNRKENTLLLIVVVFTVTMLILGITKIFEG